MKQTEKHPMYRVLRKRMWVPMLLGIGFALVGLILMLVCGLSSDVPTCFGIVAVAVLCYGTGVFDADRIIYHTEHKDVKGSEQKAP